MLNELSLSAAAQAIQKGEFTSERLVRDCLDKIEKREPLVNAWAYFEAEKALEQAHTCDVAKNPKGPLHGVPFGIKDIIATYDYPTGMGSKIYEGHNLGYDASCVALLREAGAIILGKTVTVEFAGMAPPPTKNPHNLLCTPGGSSSGSAAAVADFMVPVAYGTQTAGSIHRPAAYCGVIGYKPTFDSFNTHGIWPAAQSLDTLGLLSRSMDDVELVSAVLLGRNPFILRSVKAPSRLAICRTHLWETVMPETSQAILDARERLAVQGVQIVDLELPSSFETLIEARDIISSYERARATAHEWFNHRDKLSEPLQKTLKKGFNWAYDDYVNAMKTGANCRKELEKIFDGFDALIAPCTAGEAPPDLKSTGDHTHIGFWNILHVPSYSLPTHKGPNGMPVALQLIGRHGADRDLYKVACWIMDQLSPKN